MTTQTPIATQVGEMDAPPEHGPMSAFGRERDQLAERDVPDGVIEPGDRLPDAELLDPRGQATTLQAALGEGLSVLVFYRGAWCPFCNLTLRTYQTDLLGPLDERGVALVAVSPQTPDGSLSMEEKHDLDFAVLSDPGNALASAAGVLTAPSAEARAAQLELGLDLEEVNADGTTAIPMPTTLIVDREGTLLWIDVHTDYGSRTEPAEVLAALDDIGPR